MERSFRSQVRVRLSETDALGVVYYGQYLTYFDISRLELLREAGVTAQLLNKKGLGFVAGQVSCRYLASAKFDDLLTLQVRVSKLGTSSVSYSHLVKRGQEVIAEGEVTDVMVDGRGRPVRLPPVIRKMLSKHSG